MYVYVCEHLLSEGQHQGFLSVLCISQRPCHCVALTALELRELRGCLCLLIVSRGVGHSDNCSCCVFSRLYVVGAPGTLAGKDFEMT